MIGEPALCSRNDPQSDFPIHDVGSKGTLPPPRCVLAVEKASVVPELALEGESRLGAIWVQSSWDEG
jgi:hypothetical protein